MNTDGQKLLIKQCLSFRKWHSCQRNSQLDCTQTVTSVQKAHNSITLAFIILAEINPW